MSVHNLLLLKDNIQQIQSVLMKPFDSHTILKITTALEEMDDFVFLETSRVSTGNHLSYLFTEPVCWLECKGGDDPFVFLQLVDEYRAKGKLLAGWFGYEFGYLLEPALGSLTETLEKNTVVARLGVFKRQLIFDHALGASNGGKSWPIGEKQSSVCTLGNFKTNISRREFLAGIAAIQQYIQAGDSYQVNYTFKLDFSCTGSIAALYCQLRNNQSVGYGAWLRSSGQDIMSFSPELFFTADRQSVQVRPMKGTIQRGHNSQEEHLQSTKLCQDIKSKSENVMIVDLLRNDLARLLHTNCSGSGQVKVTSLFDVEAYESLLQMTSTIVGVSQKSDLPGLLGMLRALFPCGSVTGAPKIRTMEIIHELEKEPRGVYCGAIGYCGVGEMCFNVPIRTLTLSNGKGRMGIGAGIVYDSNADEEWEECLLKGRFLTHPRADFQLIETLCWHPNGGYVLLQEHLERLIASAQYFFFQVAVHLVQKKLMQEAELFENNSMRVRLLLFKDGRMEVSSSPLLPSSTTGETLPAVAFSSEKVDVENVFLYHKTTQRALYNVEREMAVNLGFYEILFTNTKNEVTEGTVSTFFVEKDGTLYTPPVSCGLLPGTFRCSYLAAGHAEERVLSMDDVHDADALFVANSVRGLVQVRLVE